VDAFTQYELRHGPPKPPEGYKEVERQALEHVRAAASKSRGTPFMKGFEIEEVRLSGEFPRTLIEVLFSWSRYPGLVFGHARGVWSPNGSYEEWEVKDLLTFLVLDHRNRRRDLPPREPDEHGVRW
jgi:hypothetical protein